MINNFVDWLTIKASVSLLLFVINVIIFWQSVKQSQAQRFYSDTPWLWWLGIYVWGDGLILAPFWMLVAVMIAYFPALFGVQLVLLFFALRSAFEVMYWLNHQAVKATYQPPLFRRFPWLGAQESAILYQLLNFGVLVLSLTALLGTFRWE